MPGLPILQKTLCLFDADFIPRARLLERMGEMRDALVEVNARVIKADRDIAETFDRAWRMLRMRRILASHGDGFAVLNVKKRPRGWLVSCEFHRVAQPAGATPHRTLG